MPQRFVTRKMSFDPFPVEPSPADCLDVDRVQVA